MGSPRRSVQGSARSCCCCAGPDVKAAARPVCSIATLVNRRTNDFRDQALHRETNPWMLPGQGGQRTTRSVNDVPSVSLDVSERPELLVHHDAGHFDPVAKAPCQALPSREFFAKPLSCP